jgi:hypothetical protein
MTKSKNYRIVSVFGKNQVYYYYPQKKVFLFFWQNIFEFGTNFLGGYDTFEEAKFNMKEYINTKSKTKVLYFSEEELTT